MYGVPHGRGANLLMYNTDEGHARADLLVRRLRRRVHVQGPRHRVRLTDLHRRRGAVPDGDEARARHQEPLRPGPEAVRRRRRPAQAAEREHRRVLERLPQGDLRLQERRLRGRHHLAGHRQPRQPTKAPRSRPSSPRRARPAGPTPGWSPPRPSTPTAPTSGSTGSSRRRSTPRSPSTSVRRPPTAKACDLTSRQELLHDVPRLRRGLLEEHRLLDHAHRAVP